MKKMQWAALLMAGVMTSSVCIPTTVWASDGREIATPLIASFDFNQAPSDGVIVGNGATAKVNGNCQILDKISEDKALYLDGGNNYLSVVNENGSSPLTGKEEITISFDTKQERTQTNWLFYAAPDGRTQTYNSEQYLGIMGTNGNIKVERFKNAGERPLSPDAKAGNGWSHVDVSVGETETKLYINGVLAQTVKSTYKLSDILGNNSILQLGKANWGSGEYCKGWVDNFRVYDGRLSEEEIKEQYDAFADEMLWDGISLPTEPIKENITLPSKNSAGQSITWKSGNTAIIRDDGTLVEQPDKDTEVVFTAEIAGQTKKFSVIIAGQDTLLQQAVDAITLMNEDDVRGNLPLIKEGKNGAVIDWESSNKAVITDTSSNKDDLYDGGVVTRPEAGEEPAEVKLTANVKLNDKTKKREFDVTVQPKPEKLDTEYNAGYLWTNFDASEGYEKIFFGYSEDGLTWEKLNKDAYGIPQPVLTNDAEGSDLGVRDPHLIRSPEGDRYWILGTDLHAEGGGPGGSGWDQLGASQNIVVWESADLVNWSEPRLVYAGFDQAGCVWAPEAIYDKTTGDYVIYWSARDKSKAGTDDNALRVYVCRTRDFNTFSEPQVWLSEDRQDGKETNIIDSSIVQDEKGDYYRFSTSDWNTIVDTSRTLAVDDVFDVSQNPTESKNGNWKRLVERDESGAAGFGRCEGLTVYQLPDGTWCAMGDNGGYTAYLTDDLSSGKFEQSKEAKFVDGRFRHGTVVRLSKAEEQRVLEAFGEKEEPIEPEKPAQEPVLEYNFEKDLNSMKMTDIGKGNDTADDGTIFGSAKVTFDETRKSNVLQLDGKDGSYGQLPTGFFDNRNTMTISMDVKSELNSGNFFTFTYGKNNTAYDFLRVRGTEIRNAVTNSGWQNEQEVKTGSGAVTGTWQKVDVVIDGTNMKLYVDGMLVSENKDTGLTTSSLGKGLISYLGKSLYDGDQYFKGSFDNIAVYNRALTEEEIVNSALEDENVTLLKDAVIGTVPENPADTVGTDHHTAVTTKLDAAKKEITSYVRKGTDLTQVSVDFKVLGSSAKIQVNGKDFVDGSSLDLSKDSIVTVSFADRTESWTLRKPKIANNPVLPGQYADPDIDYLDGKYWIYPTTDGYAGWGGSVFHAWSSEDMVNWTDEGIILDVANKNPGTNDKGVQIASSAWSDGNAWAPSIEEKNGKYYFYYCGNIRPELTGTYGSGKAIGVAVADNPAGPYVASESPIVYPKMMQDSGIGFSGQVIDPSVFTDDDGSSYLFFGNGNAAVAKLNENMQTVDTNTLRKINGLKDFRESVVVTKRDGLYHFTWSCDDTGSPNYHVNYGTADSLDGDVTFQYTLLQKDEANDMLGTAHQSVLYMPETDECYIAYHRFYTPLGIYTDGLGSHRESCIDKVEFDENGLMKPVTPTMEGVSKELPGEPVDKSELEALYNEYKDAKAEDYKEGFEALKQALLGAEEVLADEEATQEDVDKKLKALQDAIAGLVPVDTDVPGTGDGDQSGKPDSGQKPDQGSQTPPKGADKAAKTGDDTNLPLMAVTCLIAATVIVRRKKTVL